MSKKLSSNVIAVVVGVAVFVMLASAASLTVEAITISDVLEFTSHWIIEGFVPYIWGTIIGVVALAVIAIVFYCLSHFTKYKKAFGCTAAVVSLALAVYCIVIGFVGRAMVLGTEVGSYSWGSVSDNSAREAAYAAATSYLGELITMAVAALVLCAFFTVFTINAFKKPTPTQTAVESAAEDLVSSLNDSSEIQ